MKIVQIVPGSGGTFYCENCMRDSSLVKALRALGHDAMMVPLYLPIFMDDPDIAEDVPVFFGGVNVWLQQKLGFFRKTPRWLDRLFDSRWLLDIAARQAGSTSAKGMGAMTLSMIHGADGRQAKELDRLIKWLSEQERPDVVHISTVMLIGLAERIKVALNVPVVISLQDEDTWIDALDKPYDQRCWDAMKERVGGCDAFVAVSSFYADFMRERLEIPLDRLHTVHIGIDQTGYERAPMDFDPPVLGYLSKLSEPLGLGRLVDAFVELKRMKGLENLKLRAMGGITSDNKSFITDLKKKLASEGMLDDVDFSPELDMESRQKFLTSLSVLSVPMSEGEAFGAFMLEAWAAGVPVVQPRAGGFAELIELTGGGILYDAVAGGLVPALESLLRERDHSRTLGEKGLLAVKEHFSVADVAKKMVGVYEGMGEERA
ncbi:MAG: glycosyltransferase family 4 protein [Kiritimatiellae bacterium]|nr:glycosyltransferase family 4 protein [Kiritimatiellia bacterium]